VLLSHDGTKAFVCVPKTGTNSVRAILHEFCDVREVVHIPEGETSAVLWGDFIDTYHNTVGANLHRIQTQFPSATLDSITAYGFLRDPVERWCSAVDFHYKRQPWFLMGLKSVMRNPAKLEMLWGSYDDRLHRDKYMRPGYGGRPPWMNKEGVESVNEFYSPDVLQEMANTPWEEFPVNPDEGVFFYPQAHWLAHPNTIILDYSKFDEELEWMINWEWGSNRYYQKSNTTYRNKSDMKKLPVSDSMRKKIMDAYHMDYDLTFHTVS
jgi:hypothetical protein